MLATSMWITVVLVEPVGFCHLRTGSISELAKKQHLLFSQKILGFPVVEFGCCCGHFEELSPRHIAGLLAIRHQQTASHNEPTQDKLH